MNTMINNLIGSVVWIHGPNSRQLPFLAYIASFDNATAECYMVHEDEFLATADDLIYGTDCHDHYLPLVVQPRLSAAIPCVFVGRRVTTLNDVAVREITQMASGVRRAANRTGVLVRETDEYRWENVLDQKKILDRLLSDIIQCDDDIMARFLLIRAGKKDDVANIAREYLMSLLNGGDWSLLGITPESLKSVGLPGLAAEFISTISRSAAENLLDQSASDSKRSPQLKQNISGMRDSLHAPIAV